MRFGILKSIGFISIFTILTILTQIGGLINLLCVWVYRRRSITRGWMKFGWFLIVYSFSTFIITPLAAPLFGRERVVNNEQIRAKSFAYLFMNRNYVVPEINALLERVGKEFSDRHPNIHIVYLDAGFPFINGVPMLPHLSHSNGKKLDLCFIYEEPSGIISNKKKSRSGYGVFVDPEPKEINQTAISKKTNRFYDYPRILSFGSINRHLIFSKVASRNLINILVADTAVNKIFIEPHLVEQMDLIHPKIRFQGCHGVRHDDHIHLQIQ